MPRESEAFFLWYLNIASLFYFKASVGYFKVSVFYIELP